MSTATQLTPAQTTLQQLGGANRLKVTIGASQFFSEDNDQTLSFRIMRGAKNRIKIIKIRLNAMDLYDVTFMAIKNRKDPDFGFIIPEPYTVAIHGGIYADQLQSIIEQETGLYLSLGRIIRK